jgi:hypothetical protein
MRGPHASVVGLCSESQSQGDHDGQTRGVHNCPLQVQCTKVRLRLHPSAGLGTQPEPECEGHVVLGLSVVRVRAAASC